MDRSEIRARLRQEIQKRTDELRCRAGLPPKSEPVVRPAGPAPEFFFSPEEIGGLVSAIRLHFPEEVGRTVEQAEKLCARRFDLLGYRDLDFGDPIDWHADAVHGVRASERTWFRIPFLDFRKVGDHKVIWELNRHQHFVTLAKAWLFAGEDRYVEELVAQWRDWQARNPYPVGINWASCLEVAFRSLSWLWIRHLLARCPALPEGFTRDLTAALGQNARHIERYLSTYFAPNTHLLGEAVALFFIGTLCPEFVAAPRWRQTGWEVVLRESRRQVRADGMHFEQSTYYHVYALDFFLHARLLAGRNRLPVPAELDETIERMAGLLCGLSQAGMSPRFGDDDGGRVFDPRRNGNEHLLDPLSTAAVLYGRRDFKAAAGGLCEETVWLMGEQGLERFGGLTPEAPPPASRAFEASGLYVLASAEPVRCQIVIDAGPMGAFSGGHGHADALSLQLTAGGRHLLADPGTCCYPVQLPERNRFRGTSAHSTLQVDGRDQSDPQGPFSWSFLPPSQAERWVPGRTFDFFTGSHEGYLRLREPVIHRRSVVSLKTGSFLVRDQALGEGFHKLDLVWRLHPSLTARHLDSCLFVASGEDAGILAMATSEGNGWTREVLTGEWSPAYGQKTSALMVRYHTRERLPAEFATLLVFGGTGGGTTALARLERLPTEPHVAAYRFQDPSGIHTVCFSQGQQRWEWGEWSSDADLVCFSIGPAAAGNRRVLMAAGSYIEFAGRRVVSCGRPVDSWEWLSSGVTDEVFCSDPQSSGEFDRTALPSIEAL